MKPLRKCSTCGLEAHTTEDLELFVKSKRRPYGRGTICKKCNKLRWGKTRKLIEGLKRPILCYFCGKEITKLEGLDVDSLVFHSLDGNHDNWDPQNKVPAHHRCHLRYHTKGKNPVGEKGKLFRPKIQEDQRLIIVRALRAYLFRLVKALADKGAIGPEHRDEADHLEEAFMIYERFRTKRVGRRYPTWWRQTYDARLKEIYWTLKEDEREEERAAEGKPKSSGE